MLSAPGWAFGLQGEKIGEVNPDPWTSLDISYHYWSGERAGKVDVMVFGPETRTRATRPRRPSTRSSA